MILTVITDGKERVKQPGSNVMHLLGKIVCCAIIIEIEGEKVNMTNYNLKFSLDLDKISFSRREANFVISHNYGDTSDNDFYLRYIYDDSRNPLFKLNPIQDNQTVDAEISATATKFTMSFQDRKLEIIMPEPNVIRIRTSGLGLRMTGLGPAWSLLIPAGGNRWRAIISKAKMLFQPVTGELKIISNWRPKTGNQRHHGCKPMIVDIPENGELLITGYESEMLPQVIKTSFDDDYERVTTDFAEWLQACPEAPERYTKARQLAAYIGWSSVIPPAGNLFAPAMLMSNNQMTSIWNWDNYFNAWASTYRDVDFAWNQFLLYFKHQHETGALGDGMRQHHIGWSYTKPPVHGWILARMMEITDKIDSNRLEQVYEPLCRWTEWWFTYRDDDNDGICQYHHGNDSGWDDASAFDVGTPAEAPDLNALLVIQMEVLSDIAQRLGKTEESQEWQERSQELLTKFLEHSWLEGQFQTLKSGVHTRSESGDCLLNYIPLILGHLLPEDKLEEMIDGLTEEGRFLTEWGLATEAVNSPEFIRKGYWRGAIWPPPMMMIIDGLADAGKLNLAKDLAQRFCHMCDVHGFGENHDAVSGEIHYDTAYTWSKSVWQILAQEYLKK